ncbi:MAG TPA: virulence RhuM family protein, partial [Candidatus Kapabacteria bacterium]|nr:virulence RhuM family protein [Candidatus Kapabacteria bacterium]
MNEDLSKLQSEFLLYSSHTGEVRVDVLLLDETVWLTQRGITELFGKAKSTVSEHITSIFRDGELDEDRVVRKFRTTAEDGKEYLTSYYDLDVILAVGYRVKSPQGVQFRQWASGVLKEYVIKGFALDDERLKQGERFGKDYFDELLERIREIRASERRFYLKITDIYQQCSIDYTKDSEITQKFFKTVQNKLHWAITGHTAAEIIAERATVTQPNMGLKTWKNSPRGKILKTDVVVAKNYLNEEEMKSLERIVSMYLDYAENQAARQIPMKMVDWVQKLDGFLQFNEYDILKDSGTVSHEVAKQLAEHEYEKFRVLQDR